MPAVVRTGDMLVTGHGCSPVTTIIGVTGAAAKVFANGIPVACLGNPTMVHAIQCGPSCCPHVGVLNVGCGSVFVTGIPLGRVGDPADAGVMIAGSPNVFAGDGGG